MAFSNDIIPYCNTILAIMKAGVVQQHVSALFSPFVAWGIGGIKKNNFEWNDLIQGFNPKKIPKIIYIEDIFMP